MNDPYAMNGEPFEAEFYEENVVGAPPPLTPLQVGAADLLAKLAIIGVTVATVAGIYAIAKKMNKSHKKTRRQAGRSMTKLLGKAAEKHAAHAVDVAGDKAVEFLTSSRGSALTPLRTRTEILNHT